MEGDQPRTTFPSSGHVAWEASARGTDTESAGLTVAEEFGGDLQNDLWPSRPKNTGRVLRRLTAK